MDVREKLVEKAISHFWYGISHDIFSEPVTTYAKLAIEALKKDNGVTVQEWISVKDRLPEDDLPNGSDVKQIKVLTALKSDKGVRTVRSQMRYRMTWYNSSPWAWKYSGSEITHWMYLPQPPKGE